MTTPSLVTEQLTKKFGTFTALSELDLKIEGAKCLGFLGPNGAGKTTTLKMMTDMIFPTHGEVFLNGVSVQRERKDALAHAGVLIETPEIYASLTPREALSMVSDLRGVPPSARDERIRQVLGEVKMTEWADHKVGTFSKGMKQRINIAAALVHDPPILLLDEPTSGLDPRGMAEVREIIRALKRGPRLIFMSSHILSEVSDVCDEVALLDRGKLLLHNTLANVGARFMSTETVIDVGFAQPVDDAALASGLEGCSGLAGWNRLDPQRVRLRVGGGLEAQNRLFQQIAALPLHPVSFTPSQSALEETYLRLISKGD
ncbi:MAG: ABC transporter ATP-binding protein [Thermoplasmata archaeon]